MSARMVVQEKRIRREWIWRVSRDDLQLYLAGKEVSRNGITIILSRMQAKVLAALMLREGGELSMKELIEFCYENPDLMPDTASWCVAVYLSKVSIKLKALNLQIKNRYGFGWRLEG